jgi:hypothetical protein
VGLPVVAKRLTNGRSTNKQKPRDHQNEGVAVMVAVYLHSSLCYSGNNSFVLT